MGLRRERLLHRLRQTLQHHSPAVAGLVLIVGPDAVMGEGEERTVPIGCDGDGDPRTLLAEAGPEIEDQAARAVYLEIFALMRGELVAAAFVDPEAAADAGVDLAALHHPVGSGEQPFACGPGIEPGVEHALRRGGD